MDAAGEAALQQERTNDTTHTGSVSGQPRRKEIWFHNLDGRLYSTGTPGQRDWYKNMVANPDFTFHLKGSTKADLAARATPIGDSVRRRQILAAIDSKVGRGWDVEAWVEGSPLAEVVLAG